MDLHVKIISPEKTLFSNDAGLVQVPGVNGEFTILRNHAPVIARLIKGKIRVISKSGKELLFDCDEGLLEHKDNLTSILISN